MAEPASLLPLHVQLTLAPTLNSQIFAVTETVTKKHTDTETDKDSLVSSIHAGKPNLMLKTNKHGPQVTSELFQAKSVLSSLISLLFYCIHY